MYNNNGLLLTLSAAMDSFQRRLFNLIISNKVRASSLTNIHQSAYIRGLSSMEVGSNFIAGRFLWLEAITQHNGVRFYPRIRIGDNVAVNESVHIAAVNSVTIGNNVLMASKIYISDHNHGTYQGDLQSDPTVAPNDRQLSFSSVVIEDNVWIGEFVSILPGVIIGEGSIIGSNSVITHTIPPRSIAVGSPARVIKQFSSKEKRWIPVK
jgi:lipopolysaccharide O-acetyltransferase